MDKKIRIWIVAEDPYVRASLAAIVDSLPDCFVSGQSDPFDALAALEEDAAGQEINLLVWDLGWSPDEKALPYFRDLDLPVILLLEAADHAAMAWASGAKAIIPRVIDREKLHTTIKAIDQGLLIFDPSLTQAILPNQPLFLNELVDPPTPRELEVLRLLAEGLTNKAIGSRLDISEHTVKFHVNSLLGKLNVQSRTEAVVRATQLGLIAL